VIKNVISHPTRAQYTLSAVAIVHISLALPAVLLLRGLGTSFQDGVSAGELRFELSSSVITMQCDFRAQFKKDAPHKSNIYLNRDKTHVAL
jgi:hypothetical protein